MMTIQRLHELFDENPEQAKLGFDGSCHDCGKEVRVGVALTSEGFAISGGAVYEPEPGIFFTKCERVSKESTPVELPPLRSVQPGGRLPQPIEQWNEGKQAEFRERKPYRV